MSLQGKTISILGDSISTFPEYSCGSAADRTNSTIRDNVIYYSHGTWGVTLEDTWWMQVIRRLGLRLLVNNSWSGSCILRDRFGTVGTFVDRCVQLHTDVGDRPGEEPDIIAVFMGTNDFSHFRDTIGTEESIRYDRLILRGEEGFSYGIPVTTCEAYAITLHRMRQRYPNAQIFCMSLLPRRDENDGNVPQPIAFNQSLARIAAHFGCHTVDLFHCGIPSVGKEFDGYFPDQRVHPNVRGMTVIADCFVRTVQELQTKKVFRLP